MVTILFLLGLFTGSFANVLIYRLPQNKPWISGRSYCPKCKHPLFSKDLIPLFSWLYLRGKCRYCHKPISYQYPLVELTNGILWGAIGYIAFSTSKVQDLINLGGWQLGSSNITFLNTIIFLFLSTTLLILLVIDLKHYIIPDQLTISIVILSTILILTNNSSNLTIIFNYLMWGASAFSFFYFLHFITKGHGMGWGDVKLVFALGLLLNKYITIALMSSFIVGAVIGIILLLTKIRKPKQPIPFGPFLVIGTIIALTFGQSILNWYLPYLGY